MKPVLIFEHIESSNPGLFRDYLEEQAIPFRILYPNAGDSIPAAGQLTEYSGLCFLGGTESVTAPTPAMLEEIALIQAALTTGMPMIGHCLGGQLLSHALGGEVRKHEVEEFGWSGLYPRHNPAASDWLPESPGVLRAMQWHSDSFTIPPGATQILSGEYCGNQAFVMGNILAMQFHVEIDRATIARWALDLKDKHPPPSSSVQSGAAVMALVDDYFPLSRAMAWHLYGKWSALLAAD